MRSVTTLAAVLCASVLVAGCAASGPASAAVSPRLTSASSSLATQTAAASPADGVLLLPSLGGLTSALGVAHICSASVVDSPGRDLVITAAHCLYGAGATLRFAPGYHDGATPYGVWSVTRLYVEPSWVVGESPDADVAILRVAPLNGRQVQDVVGGRPLGDPVAGASVTVSGFPMSSGTASVCTSVLTLTQGYPTAHCPDGGMTDGVSGGAWVRQGSVVGVVGGYQQGGCADTVAYSTPFDATTRQLLARAEAGGPGNVVVPGWLANDDCS